MARARKTNTFLNPKLLKLPATNALVEGRSFVEKLCDVIGSHLNPRDKFLVLCVDEKSHIWALDRTRPVSQEMFDLSAPVQLG
jgi:hypothetical protein